eukprot:6539679-Lingulodinium_polyedra.AAC.1
MPGVKSVQGRPAARAMAPSSAGAGPGQAPREAALPGPGSALKVEGAVGHRGRAPDGAVHQRDNARLLPVRALLLCQQQLPDALSQEVGQLRMPVRPQLREALRQVLNLLHVPDLLEAAVHGRPERDVRLAELVRVLGVAHDHACPDLLDEPTAEQTGPPGGVR